MEKRINKHCNYRIKINLAKLKGAKIANSKTLGRVLAIPLGRDGLFFSEKTGAVYLQLRAIGNRKKWQTHSIKQLGGKEGKEAFCGNMTEEEYYGNRKKSNVNEEAQDDSYVFNIDGLAI